MLRGPLYYVMALLLSVLVFWRDSPVGIISLSMMTGGDGKSLYLFMLTCQLVHTTSILIGYLPYTCHTGIDRTIKFQTKTSKEKSMSGWFCIDDTRPLVPYWNKARQAILNIVILGYLVSATSHWIYHIQR